MQPEMYAPTPIVIENTSKGERSYDIYSRLMVDRIVFLGGEVNRYTANSLVAQILFLQQTDPDEPIHMYINSPGGSVYDGLAIYDIMQHVTCPVYTYCTGLAASMGSLLLAAGEPGHRHVMPHSRIMIHQPLGGARGQCSDIQIQAQEIQDLKNQLNQIYIDHSSVDMTMDKIVEATDRDNYLSPEQAIELGIVDKIIARR